MTAAVTAALAVAGTVVAGFGLYLAVLALAYLFFGRRPAPAGATGARSRLVVLIPAHDEQQLLGRCVRTLRAQAYPGDLVDIVVIADNCSDATAEVAAAAGARVMVRDDPANPGKGRALRWAMDELLRTAARFDAVIVVDADSEVDRGFLAALAHEFASGHAVVQADYTLDPERGNVRSELIAAAVLLFHRVRFGGRRALGLPAFLVGNGMLFSRQTIVDHGWNAFSGVEDLEETIQLRLRGIQPRFAAHAHVSGAAAATAGGVMRQRVRWEGGRFHVIRTRLPELVRASLAGGRADLLDAAIDLATLPLGLLAAVSASGTLVAWIAVAVRLAAPPAVLAWLVGDALLMTFVIAGLLSVRAPASTWRALLVAPAFVAWKVLAYGRILRRFDPARWDRSDRTGDAGGGKAPKVEIAGVPIDPVDFDSALAQTKRALDGSRLFQVTTVNLDFVVHAQKDARLRQIYRRSDLNVADGTPVVWLGRLLGARIPGRIAGADLVPALVAEAASSGHSVFLLGGEAGAAEAAAARLCAAHPSLQIAGTLEPSRVAVEEMDNTGILERLADARPDLLLVAFGNPKQERWIDMHREQLPVKVVIGVGCVFDLLAGRRERAPRWMQAIGLEWAFRLVQEPRRLLRRYASDAAWLTVLSLHTLRDRLRRRPVAKAA